MISKYISVVITTKDRPETFQNALISLSKQTTFPGEVVIVDDGSNPKVSVDDLKALQHVGVPVRLLRNDVAVGAAKARNLGVSAATKEFIAFLDDDDEFRPEKISVIDKIIEQNGWVDFLFHKANVKLINENLEYETKYRKGHSEGEKEIVISNYVGSCSLVVCKKSLLFKVGLFDEELPACEDWDLWIRCIQFGANEFFVDEVLTDYSCVSGSLSVFKNFVKNKLGKMSIKQKYTKTISSFSPKEKIRYSESYKADDLQRFLLANKYRSSLRCAFELFKTRKTLMNFFKLIVVLSGTKNALLLRSLF